MSIEQEAGKGKVGMEAVTVRINPGKSRVEITTNGAKGITVTLDDQELLQKMLCNENIKTISSDEIVEVFGEIYGRVVADKLLNWNKRRINDVEMPSLPEWVANFGFDRTLKTMHEENEKLSQYVKDIQYGMQKRNDKDTGATGKDGSAGTGSASDGDGDDVLVVNFEVSVAGNVTMKM